MSKHCEDCGTKMWGAMCPNCDEELCIETYQGEFIEGPLSEEWQDSVKQQKERVAERQAVARDVKP